MPRAIRKNVGEHFRLTRSNTAVELDACMATVLGIYLATVTDESGVQVF